MRRKKLRIRILLVALLFAAAAVWGTNLIFSHQNGATPIFPTADLIVGSSSDSERQTESKVQPAAPKSGNSDYIYSTHAILLDLKTQKTLYSKNSGQKTYPASLTKMMTVLVAVENLSDLQQRITVPKELYNQLVKENASMAGFLPNESVHAVDLLYGTMLPSGADAAASLAEHIAGSQSKFVTLMNRKAQQLGMNNTHFANVAGLHDPNHYTTVKDLSLLLENALKNQTFRTIFTTKRYSVSPTNKHPHGFTVQSTLFQNLSSPSFSGVRILGGKTGFTDEAGLCLATLAKKGNEEYILITTGANGTHQGEQYDITDAKSLYNICLNH